MIDKELTPDTSTEEKMKKKEILWAIYFISPRIYYSNLVVINKTVPIFWKRKQAVSWAKLHNLIDYKIKKVTIEEI